MFNSSSGIKVMSVALAAGLMLVAAGAVWAQDANNVGVVSNIKVLSDKCEDVSSPEAWKATYIKDGMSDQDKAIAIWKTVTKYRHQDNPPGEGLEGNPEKGKGNVHEPFKTIHVYGYNMCCCAAADIEGLARYIGMPARGRIINLHSVPEVWYDNSWHLLDSSLMFFLQKPGPDGKPATGPIASVDDMKKDIMDWRKTHPEIKNDADLKKFAKDGGWEKGPPLFATANLSPTGALYKFYDKDGINHAGWHGWWSNIGEYNYKRPDDKSKMIAVPPDTEPAWNVFDYGAIMGYQLNVQLREGEKLTRCWYASQAATGINRNNAKRYEKFLKGDMSALGLQKAMGDLSPGRIGNGVLEYDALADSKLAADALTFDNLTVDGGKLRVKDASKPGTLIIRMPCSYLYLTGEMTAKSVVGDGGSIVASISLNNGLDWKELAKFDKTGDQKTDLKDKVFNKYDYRVKLDFNGAATGLDGLKIVHDIQHSQAPLPIITEGDNKISFSAGAQEGTVTVQGNMEAQSDQAQWIGDFHPTVEGCTVKRFAVAGGGKGEAIVPITTPGDITRVRLGAHWRARDPKDGYEVFASFDGGKEWKSMGKLDLAQPAKSTYIVFSDVPAGSKAVQVKFAGTQRNTTCIFDLRIDVDYKEPAGGFRPVKVTYTWEEGIPVAVPAAAPAAPAAGAATKPGAKPAAKKPPAAPVEMHGTVKTDEHVCKTPTDTWTIKCGPGTVAKSYTVELAK